MRSEIVKPEGTYTRNINNEEKTYLIFKYRTQHIDYTNFAIELPKGVNQDEIYAIHNGYGQLELVIKNDTQI
jgi:hypothetical protein